MRSPPTCSRRTFVSAGAALGAAAAVSGGAREAHASGPDLKIIDLEIAGEPRLARRVAIAIPNHLAPGERVPMVVLLHGLGETRDPVVGARAWLDMYGLTAAYSRLRRPPVGRVTGQTDLLPEKKLGEINTALVKRPFRGICIVTPFTPNFLEMARVELQLDAYAAWITDYVIPRARKEAPILETPGAVSIDGVSLGGYVAIEVFLRKAEAFGALGGVQASYNAVNLNRYVDGIAAAAKGREKKLDVRFSTSVGDPLREINTGMSKQLASKGVPNDFDLLPGQHDLIFLREAGALSMLRWHDARGR